MTIITQDTLIPLALRAEPVQERAARRVAAIIDAAEVVYARVGRDRFTTTAVADLLGCGIGTIYRYFPDRVSLMDAFAPDRPFI